jgi:hypothetical protein
LPPNVKWADRPLQDERSGKAVQQAGTGFFFQALSSSLTRPA